MSSALLPRYIYTLLLAGMISYSVFMQQLRDGISDFDVDDSLRYRPYGGTLILPAYLLFLFVYSLIKTGPKAAFLHLPALFLEVFLHISLYYLVLLALLPLLRRYISARACAGLWILPNFLYILQAGFLSSPGPLFVLYIPKTARKTIFILWLCGFLIIMLWKITEHFYFRRQILQDAYRVADPGILTIWQREQALAGYKKNPSCLFYSPRVKVPLSIGFYSWSIRVVLPLREYTPEELKLIFRHEIIHIGRRDCESKFFLVFCTAVCWFNPLMWIAGRHCSNDLEVSCDETVLLDACPDTREQYARLLLRTAADNRGFTTCLSGSAKALRYRLKSIMTPAKKYSGSLLIGMIFYLLVMSFGFFTFSFESDSGHTYIFKEQALSEYSVQNISHRDEEGLHHYDCIPESDLKEYLAELTFFKVTGNYAFSDDSRNVGITFQGPEGIFYLELGNEMMKLTPLHEKQLYSEQYFCRQTIDWDYLYSLFLP